MKKMIFLIVPLSFSFVLLCFSIGYKSKAISVNTKVNNCQNSTIIIDAGHGGFDGGASTDDGFNEKDINLKIALYLNDYLKLLGYNTVMTRTKDISLENDGLSTIRQKKTSDIHNRMKIMEAYDNSVFVSIHQNHFSQEKYSGMQVFYSGNFKEESSCLAECIQNNGKEFLDKNNNRLIKECGSSVYLIYRAVRPAVLVECGFLSNHKEADLLKTEAYQKKTAMAIALGVQDYFNSKD